VARSNESPDFNDSIEGSVAPGHRKAGMLFPLFFPVLKRIPAEQRSELCTIELRKNLPYTTNMTAPVASGDNKRHNKPEKT
jgi:hypothetical protein